MTKPEPIVLYRGGHDAGEGRYCWTEAIAYCAGEPHMLRFVSVTIAAPRTADLSEATIALEEATIAIDAARAHIADAIAMLTPTLNPDASYPDAPRGPVGEAIVAAHQVLLDAGLANPVEILIVQTHDERRIG